MKMDEVDTKQQEEINHLRKVDEKHDKYITVINIVLTVMIVWTVLASVTVIQALTMMSALYDKMDIQVKYEP